MKEALGQQCKCRVLRRHPSPSTSLHPPQDFLYLPLCVPICKHVHTEIYLMYILTQHADVSMIQSFALRSSQHLWQLLIYIRPRLDKVSIKTFLQSTY